MFSEPTTASYNTATDDDCSCNSCSCTETYSEKTAESGKKCYCAKCMCSECPPKTPKRFIQTVAQAGDTAANKLTNTMCDCENCTCSFCPTKKSDKNIAKASQTNKQTTDKGTGEGNKCDCSVSTIESTVKVSTEQPNREEKQEPLTCKCTECICDPCFDPQKNKEVEANTCSCTEGPNLEPTPNKEAITCKCTECKCDPCFDPKKNEEVEANTCSCTEGPNLEPTPNKEAISCKCAECKCDPCFDPKKSEEARTCRCTECPTLELTLIKEPITCKCTECKCDPCFDPKKNEEAQGDACRCTECPNLEPSLIKEPITCKCIECKCDPCFDPKKNEEAEADTCRCTECPNLEPSLIKGPITCKCTECKCDPCIDPKKNEVVTTNLGTGDCQCSDCNNMVGDYFKSPTTCFCSPCKCNPCDDPTKTAAKDNDCTCDKPKLKADVLKKPPVCDCNECTCNPCPDEKKREQTEKQKKTENNEPSCINDACDCNPCIDPNKVVSIVTQRISCNCSPCSCNPCNDVVSNKGKGDQAETIKCECTNCTCSPCPDPNIQLAKLAKNAGEACNCTNCACEGPNKSSLSSNPCDCPVCTCEPCNDPKMNKPKEGDKSKQLTVCQCPVCDCESCKDPNVKRPTEKETKSGKIDDIQCLCDPCLCNNKKNQLAQNKLACDCPVCACNPCADPNVKEPARTDDNKRDDRNLTCTCPKCVCTECIGGRTADRIECNCERCTCPDCKKNKNLIESSLKQNSPIALIEKCQCSPCKCDQCFDTNQQKDRNEEKPINEKTEICICTTCDCADEKKDDKINETCTCKVCDCLKCPFGGERKQSAATCDCDPCTCVDCIAKALKEIKQSPTNNSKNVCVCANCICVDCILATTKKCQCKKADAPVLEFKCTQPELPMGRPKDDTAKTDINTFTKPLQSVCSAKNNCVSYGCHRIITNHNFQKFEIPSLWQSPPKARHNHLELESLFKSIPTHSTSKKKKRKHKEPERPRKNFPPYSELTLPQDNTEGTTKHVGCMSDQIRNFLNKRCDEYYYDTNTVDYSKLDKYKENIKVIKNSLKKIKNAKEKVRTNGKEKPFANATSELIETMSEVGIAFDYLKKNCKSNDKIIEAIAKEIKRYASSTTFINLFGKPEKENNKDFIPDRKDIQSLEHSPNNHMRISVPTIPVLQPAMVSVRPSSAAPGQHRPGQVCDCSVCTGRNYDFMCHSGDTSMKPGRSTLVRTINYERTKSYSDQVCNNFVRKSCQQFSTKGSECVFQYTPRSDRSFNHTTNFYQTQMGDSEKRASDIYERCGNSETINPLLVKQASSIVPKTLSDLKVAVTTLEAKCRAKDKIIEETTQKLRNHLSSSVLINLMNRIEGIPRYIEADASVGIATKKSSRNAQTQIDHSSKDKRGIPCKCGRIHKDNKHVCLSGFMVINIKRITADCIIIEWKSPRSKAVSGYEIEINGQYKSRIMSGWRTCAMIHSLEMHAPLHISIYAITPCGRCQPPARAIYEIKRKEK